jgi:hypothetical protein
MESPGLGHSTDRCRDLSTRMRRPKDLFLPVPQKFITFNIFNTFNPFEQVPTFVPSLSTP